MLYIKENNTGIDSNINGFQQMLYPKIVELWGLVSADPKGFNSYPRVYRNEGSDGYYPEIFVSNNDYKEVLIDDKIVGLSFFGIGENIPFQDNRFQAPVHLCFFVNLKKIQGGAERQDEKIRQQVARLVQGTKAFGFQFIGIETGIENVFREYPGIRRTAGIKFRDMHPFHCFRLNFNVNYKSNC